MALAGLKRTLSGTPEDGVTRSAATSNGNGSEEWTTVSGGSRKKQKKEKKKAEKAKGKEVEPPLLQFNTAGFRSRDVRVSDLRDLVLFLLDKASAPAWLKVSNKASVRGVVLLLVSGVDCATLGLSSELKDNMPQPLVPNPSVASTSKLPIFQQKFSHYCPTKAPGDAKKLHSVIQTLLNTQIPAGEKAKKDAARAKVASTAGGIDPSPYLLQQEGFLENGYIMPTYDFDISSRVIGKGQGSSAAAHRRTTLPFEDWQREDGLIETPQVPWEGEMPPLLRILGIDCEMCVTTAGSELCRISVVDSTGACIYNTLVKPANPVIDYATIYSGITKELLEGVSTTLLDVQKHLATLIDYDTVLVGHSLNCDLVVLKLAHPWVIDTSVIFHHTRGPPFKASLKWLSQKWLKKEIQVPGTVTTKDAKSGEDKTENIVGHNSEEDARAAVELVNLKMKNGPSFGEFANDQESIFERLGRREGLKTLIVDHGNPEKWHGQRADKAVPCKTDEQVVEGVLENVDDYGFVFARLLGLSHALGWSQPSNAAQGKTTATQKAAAISDSNMAEDGEVDSAPDIPTATSALNEHISQVYDSLPVNTALIIMTGHNDPRPVSALSAKRHKFDVMFKTGTLISSMKPEEKWSEEDDRQLAREVAKVREGMSFLAIKR